MQENKAQYVADLADKSVHKFHLPGMLSNRASEGASTMFGRSIAPTAVFNQDSFQIC